MIQKSYLFKQIQPSRILILKHLHATNKRLFHFPAKRLRIFILRTSQIMRGFSSFLSPFLVYNLVCCTRTFQFWRKFVPVTRKMNNDAIGARINQIDCFKYIQSVRNKGCCHNYRSSAIFITVIKGEFDVNEDDVSIYGSSIIPRKNIVCHVVIN